MYDHVLHHGRKQFYPHCLQGFSTGEILKCNIALKSMINTRLKCLKKINVLNSKIIKEK